MRDSRPIKALRQAAPKCLAMNANENMTMAMPNERARARRNSDARCEGRIAMKKQVPGKLIVPCSPAAMRAKAMSGQPFFVVPIRYED
jgi:hypothetical protein